MEDAVELQPDKMGRILVSSWCELRSGETPKGDQRVRITIGDRYGEKHSVKAILSEIVTAASEEPQPSP